MKSSVIDQMLTKLDERMARGTIDELDETKEIRLSLDGDLLLAHLQTTHGLLPDKYEVDLSNDGSSIIQCGSKSLGVIDFMSHEMHMKTTEFMPILRYVYTRQQKNRALYLINRATIETTNLANGLKHANANGILNNEIFRQLLEELKRLNDELTARAAPVLK